MTYYNYFLLIAFLAYDIYLFYSLCSSPKGKYPPFVPTPRNARKIIIKQLLPLLKGSQKSLKIVDPGCGIGSLLIPLARTYPQHKFIGIEWNKLLYKICLFRSRQFLNITYLNQDMLTYDYHNTDIIVCFLVPKIIPDLHKRLLETGKKGTLIFSIDCAFPQLNEIACFDSHLFWQSFKVHQYKL